MKTLKRLTALMGLSPLVATATPTPVCRCTYSLGFARITGDLLSRNLSDFNFSLAVILYMVRTFSRLSILFCWEVVTFTVFLSRVLRHGARVEANFNQENLQLLNVLTNPGTNEGPGDSLVTHNHWSLHIIANLDFCVTTPLLQPGLQVCQGFSLSLSKRAGVAQPVFHKKRQSTFGTNLDILSTKANQI